jgi:hypothetical protein
MEGSDFPDSRLTQDNPLNFGSVDMFFKEFFYDR